MNDLLVHQQPRKREHTTLSGKSIPSHWADAKHSAFINPWDSWKSIGFKDTLSMITESRKFPSPSPATASKIPIQKPTWGLTSKQSGETSADHNAEKIKTTWLGHACFLVELPTRSTPALTRGARVLFDPVFSDRCSPSQWVGPKRFTEPPCKIEEIPEVDAVVISHNHYDHLDTHTVRELAKRKRKPHFFAPLGNGDYFKSLGIPDDHVHIMDWWDSKRITVTQSTGPNNESTTVTMDITCTPAQHFTGRGILDRFKTLWASWAVEEVRDPSGTTKEEHGEKGVKVFFGGDTGYRAVADGQNEDEVPVCPVFKEIGETFGGFDVAMIPIGAYMPRWFMSPIHCAPQDSVLLFKDIKAKRGIGMHWGTWVLTTEDVLEPPRRLAEECNKVGIEDGAFGVCDIGETLFF